MKFGDRRKILLKQNDNDYRKIFIFAAKTEELKYVT